jgi:hypothetical protein
MTTGNGAQLAPHTTPARLGQATAVEQSRAVAEVQAQVIVAQQMPRDITRAVAAMQRSCAQKSLADHAFYSFKRGKTPVTGPSVQLARELARCFGNMNHGIAELLRDDIHGQSEMLAFAWDLETNTRSSTTFIVPHRRDRSEDKGGSVALTDMRDIYENNANNGARRLREMIFAILPGWFTEDAIAACYQTLNSDQTDGKTRAERTDRATERFSAIGVSVAQLEQRIGAPVSRWSDFDLAQIGVLYRSIQRGEIRREDEFPAAAERVTAAEITGQQAAAETASAGSPTEPDAGQRAQSGPAAIKRLEALTTQIMGDWTDADKNGVLCWLAGTKWTAATAQVRLVTGILDDELKSADNDATAAAASLWAKYEKAQAG